MEVLVSAPCKKSEPFDYRRQTIPHTPCKPCVDVKSVTASLMIHQQHHTVQSEIKTVEDVNPVLAR